MVDNLRRLADRTGKPIVLTEVGYRSTQDATITPSQWPEHEPSASYDEEEQAVAYQAVLDAIENDERFRGTFWWKWFSDPEQGEERRTGFVPKGPARSVLERAYERVLRR